MIEKIQWHCEECDKGVWYRGDLLRYDGKEICCECYWELKQEQGENN